MVIGLHVSACTSCTRTMRVRRDIAIDITESVQLLVRFNALRSMPVMPKLEHYNQNAMRSMAAAALATQAAAANARPGMAAAPLEPTPKGALALHLPAPWGKGGATRWFETDMGVLLEAKPVAPVETTRTPRVRVVATSGGGGFW